MKNYTGITAARALYNQSVNFVLIEAGDELGGRLKSCQFGNMTVEAGGDSIEGTQTGSGPSNPIFELTKKQSIETQFTDFVHSISWLLLSPCLSISFHHAATFNSSGQLNFIDIVNSAAGYYTNLTVAAGTAKHCLTFMPRISPLADTRVQKNQTDLSARAGYALSGAKRAGNSREKTAEYYQVGLLSFGARWITTSSV
ncbi:hypothetical protein C8R44DRAFT_952262 [Mycena epipterygia]|nr:hypothetical protein C8R44DRAFT_952262 [Mycena epipterygia]